MLKKINFVTILVILLINCQQFQKDEEDNTGLLAALIQTQNLNNANASLATERASQFSLNGSWNNFTGNSTTSNTITTISAKSGLSGLWLDDASGSFPYSSCSIIVQFDNSAGYLITQNPQNNGACFTGDTNKGKYYKIVFFLDGSRYWYCTVNGTSSASSIDAAIAVTDNTNRTNPGSSGCGSSSWSRLERR